MCLNKPNKIKIIISLKWAFKKIEKLNEFKISPTKLSLEYFRWRFWKVANWSERSLGSRRDLCERNQHKSELLVGDLIHQLSDLLN